MLRLSPGVYRATHTPLVKPRSDRKRGVSMSDSYSERWEIMWQGGSEEYEVKGGDGGTLQPGQSFDAGRSPPHLGVVLESLGGREKLSDRRALVPGCGRGYDVETLAKYVASATGLELAPTAVASAREYLGSKAVTNAEVIQDDFLSPKTDATYDLGYDYTFFCALHPSMRSDWAKGWARFIKPGGTLIATVFPVFSDDAGNPFNSKNTGPPWPVTPEDYQVLEKEGFELISMERVAEEMSHPPRRGMEYVGVWLKSGDV